MNSRKFLNKLRAQYGEQCKLQPLQVEVKGNNNFNEAFKIFKSIVQKEKIVTKYKERQSYEKPSERKKRKRRESEQRRLAAEAREELMRTGEWDKIQKRKAQKRQERLEKKKVPTSDYDLF